jgi:hypothetical protein
MIDDGTLKTEIKMQEKNEKAIYCSATINIETSGNINIYNCSEIKPDKDRECNDDREQTTTAKGACVPASLGSKPKQSQQQKLDTLLKNNPVPSSFAASFIHTCNRFVVGKAAGSEIESKMFEKFRNLSPEMKKILKCTTQQFSLLSSRHKSLFASSLMQDINTPVDEKNLVIAFEKEISALVSGLALGDREAALEARPGKVRLVENSSGDDVFPNQIHIFKINTLRTNDNVPSLAKQDFLPEEFQQVCTPRANGEVVEWDCRMQQQPCDGSSIEDACLKVQQIQSGTSITIEGVNFFDINTKVQLRQKLSNDNGIAIDAFVYGDIDTPVTETINGQQIVVADSRVHDKIFFQIPEDTAPGIYEFYVAVPNTSTFHGSGFGDILLSNSQYVEIIPPSTARYQIASEQLWARKETAPQSFGSDEVGIKIIAIPIFADPPFQLGTVQENSFRFGDVDSEDTRVMESVLFSHTQPIAGVVLSIIGYEIDGEEAYANLIKDWTDVFVDLFKEQWKIVLANSAIVLKLTELGFWGFVIVGASIAITLAIDFFVAIWAPADLIIQDTLAFSVTDLARLTNINIPSPEANSNNTIYTTADEIKVRLMSAEKRQFEYQEVRGYLSDKEDSWYNITLRYNRLA